MPATPFAQLLAAVNGGAATAGAITVASGDSVQFSATSTVGWGSPAARWEIYSYPAGFTVPAGWSTDGTTGAYFYSSNSTPPAVVMNATWGKFMCRLTVLGGLLSGVAASQLIDNATILTQRSPGGLFDLGYQETSQVSAAKKWIGDHQLNLRVVETGIVKAATAGVLSTRAIATYGTTTTFNFANGGVQQVTMTGNITTLAFSNAVDGQRYSFVFIQDATGTRLLTIPATLKVAGAAFVLSVGVNKRDVLNVYYDGTNFYETSRAANI